MTLVTELRMKRTRASNRVRSTIAWMLTNDAPFLSPDGLPSWWPFWSDCLKGNVRAAVRAARELEVAESNVINLRLLGVTQ